jgi:MFS family permease
MGGARHQRNARTQDLRRSDVKHILRSMSFTSRADNWRDVYLAAGARAVSLAGDFLAVTARVLAVEQRGDSGYGVAALLLATSVPMVAFAPVGGRLADRFDSRVLLTVVGLVQAACCAAMAFAAEPAALVALTAVLSTGLAVSQPTFAALVPDMVARDSVPKAMAIGQTAASIGMIAGPALAGFLVAGFGLRIPLLLNAGTYLAIVVAAMAIQTRRGRGRSHGSAEDGVAADAWRLRRDPLLTRLVPATAVVLGAISVVNVVLVFFVRGTLDASAAAYGLIDAVLMIGLIIGAWIVAKRVAGDTALTVAMMISLAGMGLVFLASSTVPAVGWLIPLYIIGGGFNGAMNTIAQVLIARRVPGAARGRALGIWVGTANAAVAVGYLVSAPLLQVLTPRQAVAAAGLTGVLTVAALCVPTLRAAKRTPPDADAAQPAPEPALASTAP